MLVQIGKCRLQLVQGDITQQQVDAVVNAANAQLAGGGGVDGAIHRAGGPDIMRDTDARYPDGCFPGEAVASVAGLLPAAHLIHTVGPVWRGGRDGEPAALASCYRKSLQLTVDLGCKSVAFPAISTGVYGYPLDLAANVALKSVIDFLKWHKQPDDVRFILFGEGAFGAFARSLEIQVA
ncbi:MAG: O-acetyl-ADP-ribose deacetylase [Fuerstiella sp.]|nr:O-acetyl-ADP-ribose deacetylase [Fuerstiella sp.]